MEVENTCFEVILSCKNVVIWSEARYSEKKKNIPQRSTLLNVRSEHRRPEHWIFLCSLTPYVNLPSSAVARVELKMTKTLTSYLVLLIEKILKYLTIFNSENKISSFDVCKTIDNDGYDHGKKRKCFYKTRIGHKHFPHCLFFSCLYAFWLNKRWFCWLIEIKIKGRKASYCKFRGLQYFSFRLHVLSLECNFTSIKYLYKMSFQ